MSMPERGLNPPAGGPDQKRNSPSFQEEPLETNGTKELSSSQGVKIRGRNRWSLILPLSVMLGTATALAADHIAGPLSSTYSPDYGHRILYNPPTKTLEDILGIKVARGDSGAPAVFRNFLPAIHKAPTPVILTAPAVDPEAITPEECPNFRVSSDRGDYPNHVVDIVITKDTTIRLVGRVLVFPDQAQALDTAYNSAFYQDGLRARLEQTTNFFNKFLPFKFEVEVIQEPLMSPQPFQEISNFERLSATRFQKEGKDIYLVDGFDGQQYSIAIFMITPNPDISVPQLLNMTPSRGWVWRYRWASPPSRIAGSVSFPWHVIANEDYYTVVSGRRAPEHEITHALGIPHNPSNPRSVVYKTETPPLDRAIIAREDVQGKCFS